MHGPGRRYIYVGGDAMTQDLFPDKAKDIYHWLRQFNKLCDRFPSCEWEPDDKPDTKELCIDMSVAETRLRKSNIREITDELLCKLSETFEK